MGAYSSSTHFFHFHIKALATEKFRVIITDILLRTFKKIGYRTLVGIPYLLEEEFLIKILIYFGSMGKHRIFVS